MTVSFVYPMFNEIGNIKNVVRGTHAIGTAALSDFEIIVVNDASTDGCGALADRLCAEFPQLRVLHHAHNRKLGGTLRTGFAAARMDYVLYMDCDLPVPFGDVENVLRAHRDDPPAMLSGYRMQRADGPYRDFQSWVYNALLRLVFRLPVRDVNFSFKFFRRDLLRAASLQSEGSFIDAELLLEVQRQGAEIREIALPHQPRVAGESTIGGPGVLPQLLREMIRYRRTRWRPSRSVIFNADDFGLSAAINASVIRSHEAGVIRAASVMVTGEAFEEAAAYVRAHPSLDPGLHWSLCEGRPASDPARIPSLVRSDGRLHHGYGEFLKRFLAGRISRREIIREMSAQIRKVQAAGLSISHVDSHQHLHALPGIFPIAVRLARKHGVPVVRTPHQRLTAADLRHLMRLLQRLGLSAVLSAASLLRPKLRYRTPDGFLGMMELGRWNLATFREKIGALPAGVTEICCHPRPDFVGELNALTSDELPEFLRTAQVRATTFREFFATPVPAETPPSAEVAARCAIE